jgi:TonB-dependent starch-binding outer membrane protein SusC
MKKVYRSLMRMASVFLILFTFFSVAQAQEVTVSGKITDVNGLGMPGVNILKKGTTVGTTTDGEGNYSIAAASSDVLVISFIGYKSQEITVGSQSKINISLVEDVETLQEVVVVGYGEMRRADLTGAQTSINAEQIHKTINTTIDQAIQGRAAGVYVTQNSGQPGGGISVNIRGINTISGSNEPLYVVDGVQLQQSSNVNYGGSSSTNPLAGLNPSDIESMEILQGPSATAIYGSRGTNGVVLITTKRGKSGETKISYNYLFSLQDKPEELPVLNLQQYAQMYSDIRTIAGGVVPVEFSNPSLLGKGTDWQEELFKTAALHKHQLSLSGGSDKTTFYVSGEYFNQDGIAIGSNFKRGSVRANLDNQVRKWLKIGLNVNYNQTNESLSATQEGVINNALRIAPNIPVKNPDGSWGGAQNVNGNPVQFTPLNPVAISSLIQNNLVRRTLLGGISGELTPLKGLSIRTTFNTNIGASRQDYFTPTYRLGDKINDNASLSVNSGNSLYWNLNELVEYTKKFGSHAFTLMASHEAQESVWQNVSAGRVGFVSNDIRDLSVGGTQGASTGGGQGQWAMESYLGRLNYNFKEKYYLQAAIRSDGSVQFGSDNKWGTFPSVSGAWRISQEPFMQNIPVINELKLRLETGKTGNQGNTSYYGPLKGYSTPWGAGFALQRFGNNGLKWEETTTNNVGFNLALFENRIQLEGDFYIKNTKNLLMTAPLPDYLGTSGEGGIGPPPINIGAMQNKGWAFSVNTINYDRGGFKWESNFNISGFRAKVTKFYTETAFVDRRPWYVGDTGSGNNWAQRASVGLSPWLFQGYIYDGLWQSQSEIENGPRPVDNAGVPYPASENSIWVGDVKYRDLPTVDTDGDGKPDAGDGIINEKDRTNIGNPWPKFTLGFTNSFHYKGFDLNVLLIGVYGNDVYNLIRYNNTNPNNTNLGANLLSEAFDYAKVEGTGSEAHLANPDAHIPRLSYSNVNGNRLRFTDQFVEDGSYLRVKNISLTYHIPGNVMSRQKIVKGAYFTAGVQNAFTFTKYKGYDPEVGAYVGQNVGPGDQAIGLDYGRYPLTRVYSFSVGVDF